MVVNHIFAFLNTSSRSCYNSVTMDPSTAQGTNLLALLRDRLPAKIFSRLQEVGALAEQSGISAYLVGGLVRDLLLGHKNLDVDIAVEGDAVAFAKALVKETGAAVKTFPRFGTALVVFPDKFKLDLATTRAESYPYPAALPVVAPSSIEKDLRRRDFTINALAIRLNDGHFGELLDLYGGQRDLDKKTIRVLHGLSFVEDPTRMFRAIRFEQRFGFRIEKNTRSLLKTAAASDLVQQLSGERLQNEIMLLLSEAHPLRAIRRMDKLGLLQAIHSDLRLTPKLNAFLSGLGKAVAWWARRFPARPLDRPVLFLTALLDELHLPATDALVRRLALPERQAGKVRVAKRRVNRIAQRLARSRLLKPSETRRLLAGLPDEGLALIIAKAHALKARQQIGAYVRTFEHVKPSLTGEDLKALGLKPGPVYKKILDRLLDARLNGEVRSETDERELVKRIAKP